MEKIKSILIIAGEASGDLHAAALIKSIKEIDPQIKISGVGGCAMRQAGADIYCDIKDLAVIGLFDVLKKLPTFISLKKLILQKIKAERPDALILVDFSGFNLRLAKAINKAMPVIYYISPQVWASRTSRIKTIKQYINKMLVLFKFEEEFYRKHGIHVTFVGHPLLDIVSPTMEQKDFLHKFGLLESKTTLTLLPGSREQEIKNILPIMLKASCLIAQKIKEIQFIIAKSPQVDLGIYARLINGVSGINVKIIEGKTYDSLSSADFCLVASGTATLETAIIGKPFLVVYKMGLLNYLLYRPQIKVPYIGMVNIVAGRKVIPEFIQFEARPERISEQVLKILLEPLLMEEMKSNLLEVRSRLGEKGATARAAKIIVDFNRDVPQRDTLLEKRYCNLFIYKRLLF